jgi:hypothetical protein
MSAKGKKSSTEQSELQQQQQQKQDGIEKVWKIFKKANKAQRAKIIKELDEETVTELRARGNPYRGNALYKRKQGDRILLFSLFSPHEKYIERLAMTSFIGFIFRMLDEYTPKEAEQYKSEMDPEFVREYEKVTKQFMMEKPTQVLELEESAIVAKMLEITTALAARELIKQQDNENVDEELSDDEGDGTDDRIADLKVQHHELQKQLFEVQAKKSAVGTDVLNRQIEDLQPMMKSFNIDVDRQKEVRQNIKDTLRKLIADKAAAPIPEELLETSDETPVETPETPAGTKPNAQQTYTIIVEKIKINKAKFATSTTRVAEAMSKLAAHQAIEEELTKRRDTQSDTLESLQKEYYAMYVKGTAADQALQKPRPKDKASKKPKGTTKHKKKTKKEVIIAPHLSAFAHLKMGDMDLTSEDEFHLKEKVKTAMGLEKTQEECSDVILDQIEEFLYEYLVFNPDNHVKCAYKPNYKDPERTPLKIDPKSGMIMDEQYERKLIPPIDTFKRWERYREAHYEELRQATDDIYSEKSDFEWAIVPLEMFEGEGAKDRADEWQRKHAKEVDFSIRSCYFNVVGLLGPWEQNRDAQNYYTKDTEVLKRMMDTHMEEERFASQMTKERMKKKKAENVAELGGDDGLDEYLSTHPSSLDKYGAKRSLAAKDIPRDDQELADDEVQIEVVELGAKRVGRRWKATSEKWKFHVPAEPLEEGQLVTKNAAEFQKELEAKEADE